MKQTLDLKYIFVCLIITEIYLKPPPNDELPKEPPNTILQNNMELKEERKDSEVQPPNPVPPESQSNEKVALIKNMMKTEVKTVLQERKVKEVIDKVSESHPRNLKTKLETKLANGVSNGGAQKPKEEKPQSSEDKIDMMKQQQLIETIKQHGEEQKELIKEQKEILDEIKKTKQELQQNKNEAVEANVAKKIAVESIKQIADMAIKSIGGVSEKPNVVKNDVQAEELLEKITNDAVQEIAKKAVETIEAIQDIKPEQLNGAQPVQDNLPNAQTNVQAKPVQNVPAIPAQNVQANQNIQVNQNVQPNPNVHSNQNLQDNQNVGPNENVQPQSVLVNPQVANSHGTRTKDEAPNNVLANIVPQANNVAKQYNAPVVQNLANKNVNLNNGAVAQNLGPNINQQPIQEIKPVLNETPKPNAQIPNNVQNPPQQVNKPFNLESDAMKQHSHSVDEPQSYKRGEETQVKPETEIVHNVPLPIVNELGNNQMKIDKPADRKPSDDIQVNVPPKVQNNVEPNRNTLPIANAVPQIGNPVPVRQKREVVDCTEKISLKPEEKQICSNLVEGNIKDSLEVLPKNVDMNEVALPKHLPMDVNILHHISRQLKSFDKDER